MIQVLAVGHCRSGSGTFSRSSDLRDLYFHRNTYKLWPTGLVLFIIQISMAWMNVWQVLEVIIFWSFVFLVKMETAKWALKSLMLLHQEIWRLLDEFTLGKSSTSSLAYPVYVVFLVKVIIHFRIFILIPRAQIILVLQAIVSRIQIWKMNQILLRNSLCMFLIQIWGFK